MTAPLIFEQIRLFQWLTTSSHYLALMEGKSHLRDFQHLIRSLEVQLNIFPHPKIDQNRISIFERYIKALSVSFFEVYLKNNQLASAYLTANYANFLSQNPFPVWLISQWNLELMALSNQ